MSERLQQLGSSLLFHDRADAGEVLARELEPEVGGDAVVVVGVARGGIVVGAAVARAFGLPLELVAVRKVRHPWQPEYALGAVTPGGGAYVRARDGLISRENVTACARKWTPVPHSSFPRMKGSAVRVRASALPDLQGFLCAGNSGVRYAGTKRVHVGHLQMW